MPARRRAGSLPGDRPTCSGPTVPAVASGNGPATSGIASRASSRLGTRPEPGSRDRTPDERPTGVALLAEPVAEVALRGPAAAAGRWHERAAWQARVAIVDPWPDPGHPVRLGSQCSARRACQSGGSDRPLPGLGLTTGAAGPPFAVCSVGAGELQPCPARGSVARLPCGGWETFGLGTASTSLSPLSALCVLGFALPDWAKDGRVCSFRQPRCIRVRSHSLCLDGTQAPARAVYTRCRASGADVPVRVSLRDDRAAADAQPSPGPDAHGGISSLNPARVVRSRRGMEQHHVLAADLDRDHVVAGRSFGGGPCPCERADERRSADDRPDGDSGLRSGRCRRAVRDSFPVWSPLQWRHPGQPDPRPRGRCPGRELQHARGNSWLRRPGTWCCARNFSVWRSLRCPWRCCWCSPSGIIGAAIASLLGYSTVTVTLVASARQITGIDGVTPPATPGRNEAQHDAACGCRPWHCDLCRMSWR